MLKRLLFIFFILSLALAAMHSRGDFIPLFGNVCADCTTDQHMIDHALAEMDRLNQSSDGQYLVQFVAPLSQDAVSVVVKDTQGQMNLKKRLSYQADFRSTNKATKDF